MLATVTDLPTPSIERSQQPNGDRNSRVVVPNLTYDEFRRLSYELPTWAIARIADIYGSPPAYRWISYIMYDFEERLTIILIKEY